MKTASVLGTVALTELAAHFLSLGWGLMVLLAAFAWVALSGASVAAKARSTEDRVNALVPQVGTALSTASSAAATAANAYPKTGGTISGSVTVTGSHTVNGQVNTNTLSVSGNATTAGNHTVHGSLISDNNVSAGGQVSGGSFSGGSIHVSGAAISDGDFTSGGTVRANGAHIGGAIVADSNISASNFSGSYHGGQGGVSTVGAAPSTYSQSVMTSYASAINGIISRLNSSGVS